MFTRPRPNTSEKLAIQAGSSEIMQETGDLESPRLVWCMTEAECKDADSRRTEVAMLQGFARRAGELCQPSRLI